MTTGAAWNISPTPPTDGFPWAWFDPNASIDIPMDITDWLAKLGDTYSSHEMICDSNLECTTSTYDDPVIIARIQRAAAGVLEAGEKYGFTYRITTAGGQIDDRTLYFKIKEL